MPACHADHMVATCRCSSSTTMPRSWTYQCPTRLCHQSTSASMSALTDCVFITISVPAHGDTVAQWVPPACAYLGSKPASGAHVTCVLAHSALSAIDDQPCGRRQPALSHDTKHGFASGRCHPNDHMRRADGSAAVQLLTRAALCSSRRRQFRLVAGSLSSLHVDLRSSCRSCCTICVS